jgi:phage virion morphogenesis protein
MPGARVEIEFDDKAVIDVLTRAEARLAPDGMETMLSYIGEYLLRSTRERAEREVSPSGAAWDPLEPSYAKWKQKKRPGAKILHFDFHMLGDQLSHQVEGDTLYVGTNARYGAIHQFGGTIKHAAYGRVRDKAIIPEHETGMPARPWLGVSDDDADEIKQITLDYLQASFDSTK